MRKTIDTIFENRVSLSKQASKQASYCMQKYQEGGSSYVLESLYLECGVIGTI